MPNKDTPVFPQQWRPLVERAANALRELALNESAKERFCNDPLLRPFMQRVSRRYVAGQSIEETVQRVMEINRRGHHASADFMGESCREAALANAATETFLALIEALESRGLDCSISFDLSHTGSLVDPELGYVNARRIAAAASRVNREVMISMEGSDRTEHIYATYRKLHTEANLTNVGITVPARLYRTRDDLPELLNYPGRIRLVKGAYFESETVACGRNSPELAARYREFALSLLNAGHQCSIATHDPSIQTDIAAFVTEQGIESSRYEFESLLGLGTEQIDQLHERGFPTREYAVFGAEHFLYALNRIAEQPIRVYQALVDVLGNAIATHAAPPAGEEKGLIYFCNT